MLANISAKDHSIGFVMTLATIGLLFLWIFGFGPWWCWLLFAAATLAFYALVVYAANGDDLAATETELMGAGSQILANAKADTAAVEARTKAYWSQVIAQAQAAQAAAPAAPATPAPATTATPATPTPTTTVTAVATT